MDDLLLARKGDPEAYARIVRAQHVALRCFIARFCPRASLVDEVAQRTFIWAYEHLREFAPGTRFDAWLRAIARNQLRAELECIRRENRNRRAYLEHLQAAGEDSDPAADALRACLEELPADSRALIEERFDARASVAAMARSRNSTEAALKMMLLRIRQALRRCIAGKIPTLEVSREARA